MPATPMRPLLKITLNGSQPVVDHYMRILFASFELAYGCRVSVDARSEVSPLGQARTDILVTWKESKP